MGKKVVIIGAGTAGLSVSNALARKLGADNITVVEPSESHMYQPWWTMVGGGIVKKEASRKPLKKLLNKGIHWEQDFAEEFLPEQVQNWELGFIGESISGGFRQALLSCHNPQRTWSCSVWRRSAARKRRR